jgi:hypothetical protein
MRVTIIIISLNEEMIFVSRCEIEYCLGVGFYRGKEPNLPQYLTVPSPISENKKCNETKNKK